MEIIPVIDLMGGIVVHAKAGNRARYSPIQSVITHSAEVHQVIRDFTAFYPFKRIYLADLDAICSGKDNFSLYQQLNDTFPDIQFLIDAGIKTAQQWQRLAVLSSVTPVLGSETLHDISFLAEASQSILSLDFKSGQFLGDKSLFDIAEIWPSQVIALNMDQIAGDDGPDLELLARVQGFRNGDLEVIAAGGVRNERDLAVLKQHQVTAVLVASALHNGMLTREIVEQYN